MAETKSKSMPSKSVLSRSEFSLMFLIPMGLTYTVTMISPLLAFIPFVKSLLYFILYGVMVLAIYHRMKNTTLVWFTLAPIAAFIVEVFLPFILFLPSILMVIGFSVALAIQPPRPAANS